VKEYDVHVTLTGSVVVRVEASNPERARQYAMEHAEIGDVDSWTPYVRNTREVKES
jgi:hypothetical protein